MAYGLLDFSSPQNAGLLGLASGLLSASGPSRTPVSLGQAFGQGLMGMQQQQQLASQMQMRDKLAQAQLDEVELKKAQAALEVERQKAAANIIGAPSVPPQPFTDYPTMPGEAPIGGLLAQVGQEGTGYLGGKITAQDVPLRLAGLGGDYTKAGLKAISDQAMWDRMAPLMGGAGAGSGTSLTVGPKGPEFTIDPIAAERLRLEQERLAYDTGAPFRPSGASPTARPRTSPATSGLPPKARADALKTSQEAVDREFAKEYVPFVAAGGYADVEKQLKQLEEARDALKTGSLTGPVQGNTPDFIRQFTNPTAIAVRDAVEEVVQRNLRLILGAQFTEKEGERLIARAYNEKLSEEENVKRLDRLIKQIRDAAKAKQDASDYFAREGTLSGYTGKMWSLDDFMKGEPGYKGDKRNLLPSGGIKFLGFE